MIFIKKLGIILVALTLSVSILLFPSSAEVVQPVPSSYQLGCKYNSQSTVLNPVTFSSLPYSYNYQLLMNGNNLAAYCTDLFVLTSYGVSADPYVFQPSQSYEVNYTFEFTFNDSNFYSYIDTNLIGINSYFTNDNLPSTWNNPYSPINGFCSNYSSSINNVSFNSVTGVLTFDVTLLFKTAHYFSDSYSNILLQLDLHLFSTAIPSGNMGMFYATLQWNSLTTQAGAVWNVMPGFTGTESSYPFSYVYLVNNSENYASGSLTVSSGASVGSLTNGAVFGSSATANSSAYFQPGYTYQGVASITLGSDVSNGSSVNDYQITGLVLSSGPNIWNNVNSSVSLIDFLSYNSILSTSTYLSGNQYYITYNIQFSFTVPSDFLYIFRYLGVTWSSSNNGTCYISRPNFSCTFDSTGTLIPDINQGGSGGGGSGSGSGSGGSSYDDSGVISSIDSGFGELSGLIESVPGWDQPESDAINDLDTYLSAESDILAGIGYDTLDPDNLMDDMLDVVEWDNIDVPDARAGDIFHDFLNPLLRVFPIFIIFPLILGLIATLLGRRAS